jgi:hypothetical protein
MRLIEIHSSFDLDRFEKACKPWLEAIKGTYDMAWHGSHNFADDWEIKQFKLRSGPRDTKRTIHNAVNEFFTEKFGWPARNGLFVSGDARQALIYGKVYAIFPVGEFKCLWSPDVDDLTSTYDIYQTEARRVHGLQDDKVEEYAEEKTLELVKEEALWYDDQVRRGLSTKREIMIHCNSFYAMERTKTYYDVVRPFLMSIGYMK